MAALWLTLLWCKSRGLPLPLAVTVDHGLRPGSADEARRVGAWAQAWGVSHEILTWQGPKPRGNVQALARDARYALIGDWARARGVATIVTGHTRDDQAETLLLRLARGSGLDGLSGMAPAGAFPLRGYEDVALIRPLLPFAHARLIATLEEIGQDWIEDPSNDLDHFQRTRIRAARTLLEGLGLSSERLADTAKTLRRAREAIEAAVSALSEQAVAVSPWGYAVVDAGALAAAPEEVGLRTLARVIAGVGGEAYAPRLEGLEAAYRWTIEGGGPKGRTLGGCRLARREEGILVAREEAAVTHELELEPGETKIWDGRFKVALDARAKGHYRVRALGALGLKLAGRGAALAPLEPRRVGATVPALWTDGQLASAPLLGVFPDPAVAGGFSVVFLGLAKGKRPVKGMSS